MEYLENIIILENTAFDYIVALILFVATITILPALKSAIVTATEKTVQKTENKIDNIVLKIIKSSTISLYISIGLLIALIPLDLPQKSQGIIITVLTIVIAYGIGRLLTKSINAIVKNAIEKAEKEHKDFNPATYNIIGFLLNVLIWLAATITIAQNFGYDLSTLIAGLGVGGIAIAFGVQNILSDIFAYFSIHFDKPFKVGDYVIFKEFEGKIRKIGIKSTRLKTLTGDELIVPNQELTSSEIRNFKAIEKRREQLYLSFRLNTPSNKLQRIKHGITKAMETIDVIEPQYIKIYGHSKDGIKIYISFFTKSSKFETYLNAREELTLKLQEFFDQENIHPIYEAYTTIEQNK